MTERPLPDRGSTLEDVAAWHPIDGTPTKKKVAVGCSVGATIETYDFIGFGTAAALYFGNVFFPGSNPLSATLLAFATLGIVFGRIPLSHDENGKPGRRALTLATGEQIALTHFHTYNHGLIVSVRMPF